MSDTANSGESVIKVKFMARPREHSWLHQFPGNQPRWENCHFSFDPDDSEYDWLVVYDDLPPLDKERRSLRAEKLCCPKDRTILVTTEPSSIKSYFSDYTNQFGVVLTSQPDWALQHKDKVYQQPALQWYYGVGRDSSLPFDEIKQPLLTQKSSNFSVVGSSKKQTHTLHAKRNKFISEVSNACPQIEVFGRDHQPMEDKADSLKHVRFHLAIENEYSPHHWTEKLADTYLGEAVPLYYGCPNICEYFPPESLILVDIDQPGEAIALINSLTEKDYSQRREAIMESKRRVLYEHNLFAVLTNIINARHRQTEQSSQPCTVRSRRLLIKQGLSASVRHLYQKIRLRALHRMRKLVF